MKEHNHDDLHKEKFQLERVALFSDAVFAIAITLLVIEIKVPEVHSDHLTDALLWEHLSATIPMFIGFLVSFFVIGLYWLGHHRMFRYVVHMNQKLLWNNVLFLLPIVIMPFSTAILSEYYNGTLRLPLAVYMINICFSGFFSYRLWSIIGNSKYHLSAGLDPIILKYNKSRALSVPFIFVCLFLLSYVNPYISYIVPPFLPIVNRLIKRYYFKRYPEIMKAHLE